MTQIDFYHLKRQTLSEVLPKLLLKAYALGKRVLLKTTPENVEKINAELWTFNDESFLPHGSKKDGFAEEQPIFVTDNDENANNATFLFLINDVQTQVEKLADFERVFNIFDGNNEDSLAQARLFWKNCREAGLEVRYWQQSERGAWEQKA